MANNSNLNKANKVKNDEFYTRYEDIEAEVKHYHEQLKGKSILCNCDDPEWSNFWKYFVDKFDEIGLKEVVSTHYEPLGSPSYSLKYDGKDFIRTELENNGDFASDECIALLDKCDVVITNEPFSLFRKFIKLIADHNKDYLIVASKNCITYKEYFPYLKDNTARLGYTSPKVFQKPDGSLQKFGNIGWFTTLDVDTSDRTLPLTETYTPEKYPKYDNYDAIEVSKLKDIPKDYKGVMGVPITIFDHFDINQFEILGNLGSYGVDGYSLSAAIYINNKKIFKRILIKERQYV